MIERCRNGHVRTSENTYVHPTTRKRQCKDCPSWVDRSKGTAKTWEERKQRALEREREGDGVLSEKKIAELRLIVRCMGCGAVPEERTKLVEDKEKPGEMKEEIYVAPEHVLGCPVHRSELQAAAELAAKRAYSMRNARTHRKSVAS